MFRNYVEGRKAPYEILDPRNPLPCTYVDVMPTEKKITLGDKCQFQYVRMSRGKKKKRKAAKKYKREMDSPSSIIISHLLLCKGLRIPHIETW